jgi:hypothetical protein
MEKLIEDKEHRGMYCFYCPACNETHYIALSDNDCGFPIWRWNGDFEKPTIEPSVKVEYHGADKDTVCHSFIRDGRIQYLSDCSHELRGQTIDMVDIK